MVSRISKRVVPATLTLLLGTLAALALLVGGGGSVLAQGKGTKASGPPHVPTADQQIPGTPLSIIVEDRTSMNIRYTDASLGMNAVEQFFGGDAEGVYLWVNVNGTTTVYGPGQVPAGRNTNAYTPISNSISGSGSPSNPWVVTTVNAVPNTNLRLTQTASYVNGAEFVSMRFALSQVGATQAVTTTLFHAADLYTGGSDQGYGFYDSTTGGVGSYYTITTPMNQQRPFYQQFVPSTPPTAYKETFYATLWEDIGDTSGPGPGFDNTIVTSFHDAAAGLQWNLTVPASGNVSVSDIDLFSVHSSLCGSFSDVHPGDFAYEHVYYLACHGILGGYSDTTFRPNNNITRGQLSKIVANSAGYNEPPTGQMFQDVPPSNPFYPFVQRMASRGYIGGYACGGPGEPCGAGSLPYFRVNTPATRGQISKIVSNAKGYNDPAGVQIFSDVPPTNSFYPFVQRLASRGIMSGYTCGGPGEPCDSQNRPYFRWGNNATRAQTAKIDANAFFPGCCGALR